MCCSAQLSKCCSFSTAIKAYKYQTLAFYMSKTRATRKTPTVQTQTHILPTLLQRLIRDVHTFVSLLICKRQHHVLHITLVVVLIPGSVTEQYMVEHPAWCYGRNICIFYRCFRDECFYYAMEPMLSMKSSVFHIFWLKFQNYKIYRNNVWKCSKTFIKIIF